MIASNISLEDTVRRELYAEDSEHKNDQNSFSNNKMLSASLQIDNCELNLSTNKFQFKKGDLDLDQEVENCPGTYETNCIINYESETEEQPSTAKTPSAFKQNNV